MDIIQSNMEKKSPRQGLKLCVIALTALHLNHYTSWSRATRIVTDMPFMDAICNETPQLQPLPFDSMHYTQSSLQSFQE